MLKRILFTVGLLLLGNSYISMAYAVDGKNYPGSMCVRDSGTTNYDYRSSSIYNKSSTASLYVNCAALHDSIGSNGGSINKAWVRTTSGVTCSLESRYPRNNGSVWGWARNHSSTTNLGTLKVLNYGSVSSNKYTHYYFSCKIPPKKRIYSYQIEEK